MNAASDFMATRERWLASRAVALLPSGATLREAQSIGGAWKWFSTPRVTARGI